MSLRVDGKMRHRMTPTDPQRAGRVTISLKYGIATTKQLPERNSLYIEDRWGKRQRLKRRKSTSFTRKRKVRPRSASWAVSTSSMASPTGIYYSNHEGISSWAKRGGRERLASVEVYQQTEGETNPQENDPLRNYKSGKEVEMETATARTRCVQECSIAEARCVRPRSDSDSESWQRNWNSDALDLYDDMNDASAWPNTTMTLEPKAPVTPSIEAPRRRTVRQDHEMWMVSVIDLLYDFLFGTVSPNLCNDKSTSHSREEIDVLKAVLFSVVFDKPDTDDVMDNETTVSPTSVAHVDRFEAPSPHDELADDGTGKSCTRVVLGSTTVHRLMRTISYLNRQPDVGLIQVPGPTGADFGVKNNLFTPVIATGSKNILADGEVQRTFIPECVLLSALYRRMPKLRRFFPYVLASTCAEQNESCLSLNEMRGNYLPDIPSLRSSKHSFASKKLQFATGRAGLVSFVCQILREEAESEEVSHNEGGDIVVSPTSMEQVGVVLKVIIQMIKSEECVEKLSTAVAHLMKLQPVYVAQTLLWKLTRSWPTQNTRRALGYLELMDTILHVAPVEALHAAPIHGLVFKRLTSEAQSANAVLARKALVILSAPHVVLNLIAPCQSTRVMVQSALHSNTQNHWSPAVKSESDDLFDSLLDYAS